MLPFKSFLIYFIFSFISIFVFFIKIHNFIVKNIKFDKNISNFINLMQVNFSFVLLKSLSQSTADSKFILLIKNLIYLIF